MKTCNCWWTSMVLLAAAPLAAAAGAQPPTGGPPPPPPAAEAPRFDLSQQKVLYCVGYAHLDTQWRWDFPITIDRFVKVTLEDNFALFDKHPGYVFNFTGSVRYEMMREYYPALYERLKREVAAGRWLVSGSSVDENDVNVPSPESTLRQVLYGNLFFKREFGKESVDYMLPDCFGFPASMPSVWAHCGLLGFSTQKLTWGSAVGIPFKVGMWEGPDGKAIVAALDPGPYVGAIKGRVDLNAEWAKRIDSSGSRFGVLADYHYYGVGDTGGAPLEEDVKNYLASIDNPDSKFKVVLAASDQLYKDLTPAMKARLPRYRGDLLLTEHSAGTLTSQSYMKRWNRMAENVLDAAERASVAADWLGGAAYPREKLERAWVRTLANQMHDILPGTSIPAAYRWSWNDLILAMNLAAAVNEDAVGAVARGLDTRVDGVPLLVYNPLAGRRQDVVEATVDFGSAAPASIRVFDPSGVELPSQILSRDGGTLRVLVLVEAASLGFQVLDVRPGDPAGQAPTSALRVAPGTLENEHYRVTLDARGDVASVLEKASGRELLAAPARLVFTPEKPQSWPAWNMDWADRQRPPLGAVGDDGAPEIKVLEEGPVRVALEVTRRARGSIFVQRLRLARGEAGRHLEYDCEIDWQSAECALKASFPLAASNPKATYNWKLGTIDRGNNDPTKYEVPSHEFIHLTDRSGAHGAGILDDSKYGSDKPSDNELRLTLLYTPGVRTSYMDQHSQDWGRHRIRYALYGAAGDFRAARADQAGRRFNQPLQAFALPKGRAGPLGRAWALADVSTPQVDVRALKKSEEGDFVIVRLQELWGQPSQDVRVRFASPIAEAYEVDGQERHIGPATLVNGQLALDISPYSPRSFAIRLAKPPVSLAPPRTTPVALTFDTDAVSTDANRADGAMDAEGRTFPAEQLPRRLTVEGVEFELGPVTDGRKNALACRGQVVALPPTSGSDADGPAYAYLLAAATEDVSADFRTGDQIVPLNVRSWTGFVGQWYDRLWDKPFQDIDHRCESRVTGFVPAFIHREPVAWFATHRHHPATGNESYRFAYLYKLAVPLRGGASTLKLPDDPRIRVFALSVGRNPGEAVAPAAPLYDALEPRPLDLRFQYPEPPKPVFEGVKPVAEVRYERGESPADVAKPAAGDLAERVRFTVIDPDGTMRPHGSAGMKDGALVRLNDREFPRNDDDVARVVFYDGPGRFHVDLGSPRSLDRVEAWSWHRTNRAPQFFSLWGAATEAPPNPVFGHGQHDRWELLAVVDTRKGGAGGVHHSTVSRKGGPLGPFRHLLWITEDMGEGTFLAEIDIHEVSDGR